MIHILEFTVQGRGQFPVDMLRYERAWPSTSLDSDNMARAITIPSAQIQGVVLCKVVSDREMTSEGGGLTRKRWESFGWTVSDVKQICCHQLKPNKK